MARLVVEFAEPLRGLLSEHAIFLSVGGNDISAYPSASITVDSGLRIEPFVGLYAGGEIPNVGSFTYSQSSLLVGMSIGRYCSIGPGLVIQRSEFDGNRFTTSNFTYERSGPVYGAAVQELGLKSPRASRPAWGVLPVIEHDVWIGADVRLQRGITIGTGAVVLDGSVVRSAVAPYAVVAGDPARVVDMRFDPVTVSRLLRSRWWEKDPAIISTVRDTSPAELLSLLKEGEGHIGHYSPKVLTASEVKSCIQGISSQRTLA